MACYCVCPKNGTIFRFMQIDYQEDVPPVRGGNWLKSGNLSFVVFFFFVKTCVNYN